MSDLAQTDAERPAETKKNLNQIFAAARGLARSLDETVWAISRKNETVEQSLVFICKAAQDFLRLAGISCRLDAPDVLPASYFSSTVRHNLFLATREALNNIVKHAQATEVWLRLKLEADRLTLVIEDNGKGFVRPPAPAAAAPGTQTPTRSGLANLERRLQEIGGTAEWHSEPGQGTIIKLSVPLKSEKPPPI
jgi:signal transduction histidine kinase